MLTKTFSNKIMKKEECLSKNKGTLGMLIKIRSNPDNRKETLNS